ncbi:hypothetical protein WG66_001646 [Moniliophthora roreri]|uniref:Uncharacterized protein n=1 Tax=Moniliophthora roreri TaxID=221103 RepID=A0A0W0G1E8_MONRR|nr:hypothetical protein WG66_001646 [Moniliophthora roreri]
MKLSIASIIVAATAAVAQTVPSGLISPPEGTTISLNDNLNITLAPNRYARAFTSSITAYILDSGTIADGYTGFTRILTDFPPNSKVTIPGGLQVDSYSVVTDQPLSSYVFSTGEKKLIVEERFQDPSRQNSAFWARTIQVTN